MFPTPDPSFYFLFLFFFLIYHLIHLDQEKRLGIKEIDSSEEQFSNSEHNVHNYGISEKSPSQEQCDSPRVPINIKAREDEEEA